MPMARPPLSGDATGAEQLDAKIAQLGDWRGKTLARLRALIHRPFPTWSRP